MENELKNLREEISRIDTEMAKLFAERMHTVGKIAEYKKTNSLPIFDPSREADILKGAVNRIDDADLLSYYTLFLKSTMDISKKYQTKLMSGVKVAFCGTEGAFAWIAAGKIFPDGERCPYPNFKKAYAAVEKGECDCAVLPIENSFAGDVDQVNDLMFSGNLYVNGMYDLPVTHDLLGIPGARASDIKTVYSHIQALSQSSSYIESHGYAQISMSNTAFAAEYVRNENDITKAAIGSGDAAGLFGLEIIERAINNDRTNTTRFGVFSRIESKEDNDYFSLMFTVKNEAGSLADALNVIGDYGFNMRTLRSRPMKELPWQYYFYIEASGDIHGEGGLECLERLSKYCDKIKVVGSYNTICTQEGKK